jgi:hypothetical protein
MYIEKQNSWETIFIACLLILLEFSHFKYHLLKEKHDINETK